MTDKKVNNPKPVQSNTQQSQRIEKMSVKPTPSPAQRVVSPSQVNPSPQQPTPSAPKAESDSNTNSSSSDSGK